jgi:hypothetical protein
MRRQGRCCPGRFQEAFRDHRKDAEVIQLDVDDSQWDISSKTRLPVGHFQQNKVPGMERMLIAMTLGAFVLGQGAMARPQSAVAMVRNGAGEAASAAPDLPPPPRGKSTILGGQINRVDPVMDQFVLKVYGEKPMKILFDERTQVYHDGKRIPLRDLGPATHASVQTMLDGAQIFAVSIHILSGQPEGEYEGRVLSFDPGNGILTLTTAQNRPPFRLVVSNQTSFKRLGQSAFSSVQSGQSDLVPGSLVEVKFDSNNRGQGVATEISVLAAPGASFVFSGTLSELNLPAGTMVVLDPRDNQSYRISFDPHAQVSQRLRVGQHVRLSADYDGHKYVATEIETE